MDVLAPVYAIGDVHGQLDKLARLLTAHDLVDDDMNWTGEGATLWFMGDFVDRGLDGITVVDLVMRWQAQAAASGGRVHALLGNHEVTMLAACRFGEESSTGPGGNFRADWERNGGEVNDLSAITEEHIAWMINLPCMERGDDRLFAHADSTFYDQYGASVDEVNDSVKRLLLGSDARAWDRLLHQFSDREVFVDSARGGTERAEHFLQKFGGKQLIHGHTPIDKINGRPPETITEALVYAGGLCVDVDGGMYRGGPGFVYQVVSGGVVIL